MKYQFSIAIAFDDSLDLKSWFKNNYIAPLLEACIQKFISREITDKYKSLINAVFITQINSKFFKIQFPAKLPNRKIEILTVDECVVFLLFFHLCILWFDLQKAFLLVPPAGIEPATTP